MAEVNMLFGGIIVLIALGLIALLQLVGPKGKVFPSCYQCGRPMKQYQHHGRNLPEEIVQYLHKHNLPHLVVRRFVCPYNHRELWIAPPVGDQRKSVIVANRL